MTWSEQVFRYCERGLDPAFWAEPFNALSNAAFLVAAAVLWRDLARSRRGTEARSEPIFALAILIALVAAVGAGSFLFHTYATHWARLADVVPIGIFMAAYLAVALRIFIGWSWAAIGAAVAGFLGVTGFMASISCPQTMVSVVTAAREPCLKGTIGYVPALAALVVVGLLAQRRHPAGRQLIAAGAIFLAAMLLRWADRDVCAATMLLGRVRGTHALWHLLNAATVYVLVRAAIDAARPRAA